MAGLSLGKGMLTIHSFSIAGGEVWTAGGTYSASWNTSAIDDGTYPQQNVSGTADLVLGYREPNSTSLNLRKLGMLDTGRILNLGEKQITP